MPGTIGANATRVLPRFFDLEYPVVERGEGVWITTADGRRILDACSGGAMVASLGYGLAEIVAAWQDQAERISYFYNHHFTSEPQERLAARLLETVAPEMARVRLVSGGSEANETALQLARLYHVERGEPERWRVIAPAQAYHGSTMGTLALSGRPSLQEPFGPYLAEHLHIPPATTRFDPTGEAALDALDRALDEAGVGTWLAGQQLPIQADIVSVGKGLGAGYAPLGGVLCRQHVYDAIDRGSREFDLGHTWDGAPLSSAVGLAVLDLLEERDLVERVRERGPRLRDELEAALDGSPIVGEVRGRGFLLGIELVDPRDGESFLPVDLDVASLVDDTALDHGLLVTSTHPQADGFAGDQVLLAPAYVSTDDELAEMLLRLRAALDEVERRIVDSLPGASGSAR